LLNFIYIYICLKRQVKLGAMVKETLIFKHEKEGLSKDCFELSSKTKIP